MDLIGQLTTTLGVDNNQAESAAGAVLGAFQRSAPAGVLDGLLKSAPEAATWLQKARPLIGGAPSGAAGGAALVEDVKAAMERAGMPRELAPRAIPVVVRFLEDTLGVAGFLSLAQQVPFLKELTPVGADRITARLPKGALSALGGRLLE